MMTQILDLIMNSAGMSYKRMLFSLLFATMISSYIYMVYRTSSRKSFYSKSFNMTLPIICILTDAIVVAMQANLVVSLGMVGALSIVRFRNAIKDPLDLGFVFWAISMGIISGTELYGLALLTSFIITITLFVLQHIPMREAAHLLIINGNNTSYEDEAIKILKEHASSYTTKSRNMRPNSLDIIFEIKTEEDGQILQKINKIEGVETASILNHDGSKRY